MSALIGCSVSILAQGVSVETEADAGMGRSPTSVAVGAAPKYVIITQMIDVAIDQVLRRAEGATLNLDGYLFNGWTSGKASQVRQRLAVDFLGWKRSHSKFEQEVEKVIRALRSDKHARERPLKPKL